MVAVERDAASGDLLRPTPTLRALLRLVWWWTRVVGHLLAGRPFEDKRVQDTYCERYPWMEAHRGNA